MQMLLAMMLLETSHVNENFGFTGNGTHCDGMDFVRYILIQFPKGFNDVLKRDYLIDFLTSLQKSFDQKPFSQIFFCIYI